MTIIPPIVAIAPKTIPIMEVILPALNNPSPVYNAGFS